MPRLQVQLERTAYAPGETVRAWARALEGGGSRGGAALLRYVERTDDYEEVAWERSVALWTGDLTTGQSFACELALPPDAKPGYASPNGSLAWDVLVRSDEFGLDSKTAQPFEVRAAEITSPAAAPLASGPRWARPAYVVTPAAAGGVGYSLARIPGAVAGVVLAGSGAVWEWRRRARHFQLEPPRPVRRGESARASIRMIDASQVKGRLEVELRCVEFYDYRSHSRSGSGSSSRTTRETAKNELHGECVPLSAAQRSADIEVPATLPFSHEGSALSYRWTLIAREKRESATDRVSTQPLLVLP